VSVIGQQAIEWGTVKCEAPVRYVRRDGSLVLQQLWIVTRENRVYRREEWRDVPIVTEE
jgi:hypothetical protein